MATGIFDLGISQLLPPSHFCLLSKALPDFLPQFCLPLKSSVLSQAALCGGSRAFPDFSFSSNPHLRSPGVNLDLMLLEVFSSRNDAVVSHPLLVSETFPPCWEGLRHSPLLLHLKTGQMEMIHGNSGFPFSREQFTHFSKEISEVQMFL